MRSRRLTPLVLGDARRVTARPLRRLIGAANVSRQPTPSKPLRNCADCGRAVPYSGLGQPRKRCTDCEAEIRRKRARECYARRRDRLISSVPAPVHAKACGKCREVKDAGAFGPARGRSDGLQFWCRECRSEHQRANREQANSRSRRFRKRHPAKGLEYLRQARRDALAHYSPTDPPSCACCGEHGSSFLVLDHIHGDGAEHRRRMGGAQLFVSLRSHGYTYGMQVLCANCNHAKAYYGICPHQTGKQVALSVL